MADIWEWPRVVCVEYDAAKNAGHSAYDGDTFRADVDLGADTFKRRMPVRLEGLDAPEVRSADPAEREAGKAARDFLRGLLPVGTAVELRSVGYDKYQPRVDAIVTRKDDGLVVNEAVKAFLEGGG